MKYKSMFSGFAVGDTVESKTKGIWVWCKIHPKTPETVLLLIDTEGLGGTEKVNVLYFFTYLLLTRYTKNRVCSCSGG